MGTAKQLARTVTLNLLRAFIVVACVLALYGVIVSFHPPALFWGIVAFGRAPGCSPGDALSGANQRYLFGTEADRIGNDLRLVAQDPERGLELWSGAGGKYWIPADNGVVLPQLIAQQELDFYGDRKFGVREGDVVLDCGAHVGVFVRKALNRGAALVVAIEPAPNNVECLRRNFEQEIKDGTVVVYPKGVWDKRDVLPLYELPGNSAGNSFVMQKEHNYVVGSLALTTIDLIKDELGLEQVDFIKTDIKGATERALRGARWTLATDQPRLAISTEEPADDAPAIRALLQELQPRYESKCGVCALYPSWELFPMVVLAY